MLSQLLVRRLAPIAATLGGSTLTRTTPYNHLNHLSMASFSSTPCGSASPVRSSVSPYRTRLQMMDMPVKEGRVLSVQSHTVHGYVGNKAATLPLQLLGLEVDPLNTVHFSTHAGYKHLRGDATSAAQFDALVEGLRINGVFNYSYVLSGYARSQALLESLAAIVTGLRDGGDGAATAAAEGGVAAEQQERAQQQPPKKHVRYFLDPVLGDDDVGFYVPPELVATYRDVMLPLATVITPNTFEAQALSGVDIKCEADAVAACRALHALGPRIVVITSMSVPRDAGDDPDPSEISVMASQMPEGATRPEEALVYRLHMPRIQGRFVGCGDVFMACLLGFMHRHPEDFASAFELTCSAVHGVVERTSRERPGGELCLVQSRGSIAAPTVRFRAEAVPCPAQPISAVIFDMDGTLTLPGHIDFGAMRQRIGLPPGSDILAQIRELPEDQQASAVAIVEEEEMAALQKLELQPGLHDLMGELRARRVRCAIATRNMGAAVDFFFTSSGLERELFAPILTRDFPHNKPDARVALAIAAGWGASPESVAFVGDHVDDMRCGRDAGCATVLVRCDENDDLYAADGGALVDHAITALAELPALLRRPRAVAAVPAGVVAAGVGASRAVGVA